MRSRIVFTTVIALFFFSAAAFGLELTSEAFKESGTLPLIYTCKGDNISPPLSWSGAPEGTKSFVLIMDDPDAPLGTWIHWIVFDIPGTATGLAANVPGEMQLADGTKQGLNSFRTVGYGGPCPPAGPPHRYIFTLYAVDTLLDKVPPGANKGTVLRAMQGHIKGRTRLMATFGR